MAAAPDLLVTRFTTPSAGLFDLAGSFTDLQIASVGLAIVVNGTTVWNSSFTGSSPYQGTISFSIHGLSLAQGATIDFVVDSLGHQAFDVLGLRALITENPLLSPVMLDAVYNPTTNLTKLSGTAEANSSVSIFDGTKLVGTVTAAVDGTWSLNATLKGNTVHSFTETSLDSSGNQLASAGVALFAQAARQSLQGGSGNDVLIGAPNDKLTGGGAGSDTFVFNSGLGKNTITDFSVSQDVLRFDHTLFANATASQVISQTHDSTAGAVIVIDAADTVTLTGVTVAQLQAHLSDFQFF
jgi:Ca2+-binding RTX toxin-like protein